MVQPSSILLGVRTPPEAWSMQGQVQSPQPQAALEGGLAPLLAPHFPSLASLPLSAPEPAWTPQALMPAGFQSDSSRRHWQDRKRAERARCFPKLPTARPSSIWQWLWGPMTSSPLRPPPRGSLLYESSGCFTCSVGSLLGQCSPIFVCLLLICLLKSLPLTPQGPSDFSQDPEIRNVAASV